MQRVFGLAIAMALGAQVAAAEPLDGRSARKAVFPATGVSIAVLEAGGLSAADRAVLTQVLAAQPYYGAVAMTPSEGLVSEALVAAANYHDVEAARGAALKDCNARKKSGSADCVIVAELRPEGWEPRALQLSAAATDGLKREYKGAGAKALAISPATGKWAIAKGRDAAAEALAQCEAAGAGGDCRIVVAD